MPYTAPFIFTTGLFVTAATLNQQIYDYNLGSAVYLFTTAGDTLYATGANVPARLAVGAANTVLASTGTAPNWVSALTLSTATITTLTTTTLSVGTNPASTGALRLANNTAIYWRNAANGANTAFIKQNNIDGLEIEAPVSIVMRINTVNRYVFNDGEFAPETDEQASLGLVGKRWTAVYAVNGTIQPSHSSTKNFEQEVTPAGALDVARQTARGSGFHRFTYKGDAGDMKLREYRHIGIKAESAHEWLSPDGQTVNPQTTASLALAAVAGEADAREADIARLTTDLADLRQLITNRRN